MPELPEVETISRYLRQGTPESPSILHHTIAGVELLWQRTLVTPGFSEFQKRIQGQAVEAVSRRGKFLVIPLSQDTLIFHLRMSGDIQVLPESTPVAPHDRLMLHLDGGLRLSFNDTRKFGRAWLVSDPETVFARLGPEPFDPDFTPEALYQQLQKRKRQLKPLLLDQTFIAGLGNIYADEALHSARIHPLTLSQSLGPVEAERLWGSIRQVLEEGIRRNGATIDWVYRGGDFQNYFRVYQRTGKACPNCGTPIERIIVGQRSTHYCPHCQKLQN
ncbi:MAG: bifunctional DNA-formamidopyrimidine glycosylase/DNA-(apurinic or apyrimidinic site) lyase [Omnitrophica WOR_2 bacterium]